MFEFGSDTLVPMMIFAIPIVAIAGGIMAGIVRTLGQQRLIEMAQRERIAAIERGIDPSKLPPLPSLSMGDDYTSINLTPGQSARRRAQGLLIGGLVTFAVGVGIALMLWIIPSARDENAWAVGLVPAFIGLALLLASAVVHRTAGPEDAPAPTHRA